MRPKLGGQEPGLAGLTPGGPHRAQRSCSAQGGRGAGCDLVWLCATDGVHVKVRGWDLAARQAFALAVADACAGHRNYKNLKPLPLKRGMLNYGYSRKMPFQVGPS